MKASNPVIMVQAYRLLVAEMYVNGWDYPLHLGVTEAGEGEDGRMKSAIGIGALLQVWPSATCSCCLLMLFFPCRGLHVGISSSWLISSYSLAVAGWLG